MNGELSVFSSDKFRPFLQENWGTLLFSSVNGGELHGRIISGKVLLP